VRPSSSGRMIPRTLYTDWTRTRSALVMQILAVHPDPEVQTIEALDTKIED
jgi:hypothetical protein